MGKRRATGDAPIIRKAGIADVPAIQALVNHFADERKMLSRSLSEIYENVRDFCVAEYGGAVIGSAALHVFWGDLAEVRALAVAEAFQHSGLGRKLVESVLLEGREMGIKKAFALTYQPGFFEKLGFEQITKEELPHKVWHDCIKCPLFPNCNETALLLDLAKLERDLAPKAGQKG